jgi:hypothetical protein
MHRTLHSTHKHVSRLHTEWQKEKVALCRFQSKSYLLQLFLSSPSAVAHLLLFVCACKQRETNLIYFSSGTVIYLNHHLRMSCRARYKSKFKAAYWRRHWLCFFFYQGLAVAIKIGFYLNVRGSKKTSVRCST